VTPDDARAFLAQNHRAVMITHHESGELQTSPITVGVDDDGMAVISSRETAYKVRNLRRDPRVTLCVFTDRFFGDWIQIDGRAELIPLPAAMEGLVDYYRRISGEHPDWDDYRKAMEEQQRLLIRVALERVGPAQHG
jgi:PPOX class probable F420-dependent enzyme